MKKMAFFCLLLGMAMTGLQAQKIRGVDKSPLDFAVFRPDGQGTTPVARIIYSRPAVNGRTIFGGLVPFGKIWRTGANQSTELNLLRDITIGGDTLRAGNYTIYTIPGEKEWTIIINSALYTWGAYDYDESKDVFRFRVPAKQTEKLHEHFGIAFAGEDGKGKLLLAWAHTEVYVDFAY